MESGVGRWDHLWDELCPPPVGCSALYGHAQQLVSQTISCWLEAPGWSPVCWDAHWTRRHAVTHFTLISRSYVPVPAGVGVVRRVVAVAFVWSAAKCNKQSGKTAGEHE